MNSSGHRKPSAAQRHAAAVSRAVSKRLRTASRSLHLALLRRPRRLPVLLLLLALPSVTLLLALIFRLSLPRLFARVLGACALLFARTPASTFSHAAGPRVYDQAWRVSRDDGSAAAAKEAVEIAYFIQVGSDAVTLLPRLFARIHHPRNVYVIHIDAKVDSARRDATSRLIAQSHVYSLNMYVLPPEMVTYKAISMVSNTLAGMTLALEKHSTWDYFINLSGADYPLVSVEDQMRLLARPRSPIGRLNFISFFPRKEWVPYSFRVRNMHWDPAAVGFQHANSRLRLLRDQKNNPLEENRAYVFTKAEAWMILSRPFVEFVLRSGFAKRMLVNHVHVLSVPEHYFSDILYNHAFWKGTIVPDGFRRVVWYLKNRRSGQHPYVLDQGPTIFALWEYIADTKSLFARKFSKPDSALMDRVDAQMSGITRNMSDPQLDAFRLDRRLFYQGIVNHFDFLTKKTLSAQGYSYPRGAYPSL